MSVTLQTLRDQFYSILREEEDTNAYPLTFVDQLINASQLRICTGRVKNPLTGEVVRKGVLPFLNSTQFYSNIPVTYLASDTTVWATTLTVSSTANFETTWTLYIAGDIVTYTGKTDTTFTGCDGLSFAFKSWIQVWAVYNLPSDFASPINLIYNDKVQLPAKNYDDIFEELNDNKWSQYRRSRANSYYGGVYSSDGFYTIINGSYLAVFNMNDNDAILRLRYEKLPTTMTASTDTATIADDTYAKSTIPYLAVGEILFNRNEEQRAGEILNFALGQVQEMYDYYNNVGYESLNGKQYGMGKSKLNI